MTLTERVGALIDDRYAKEHRPQRPEWIHTALNRGFEHEVYTLASVRAAFTRLHKSDRIIYNGEYGTPIHLADRIPQYLHPQTAVELGLVNFSVPTPGFLCVRCGAVVASIERHNAFHDNLDDLHLEVY